MNTLSNIITDAYTCLSEDINPDKEYYGYTLPLEEVKSSYQVACKDADCLEQVNIEEVKSGDIIYVAEDSSCEIYPIQIR